jgi:hypothetical protein
MLAKTSLTVSSLFVTAFIVGASNLSPDVTLPPSTLGVTGMVKVCRCAGALNSIECVGEHDCGCSCDPLGTHCECWSN